MASCFGILERRCCKRAILCGRHLPPADTQAARSGVKYHRPREVGRPPRGKVSGQILLLESCWIRIVPGRRKVLLRYGVEQRYAYGEGGALRINEWGPAKLTSGGKVA